MLVTVASFKGGVGKTTSAVHIAAYLQQQRGKTLLVDGDPNRSATGWARRGSLPFTVIDEKTADRRTVKQYQYVVVDTPARPDKQDLDTLSASDLLILPVTPDVLAVDALLQTVEAIRATYKILLTVVPPKPSQAGSQVSADLRQGGWPVFQTGVRRLTAFQRAALLGCLVQDVPSDPRARDAWADYCAIGKELLK